MSDAPEMLAPYPAAQIAQRRASDPRASAWVSANAGSGKTHVLVARVLRLLLDGARPSAILCLTFTKAAAANMTARVFKELSQWTQLDDAQLSQAIARTGAPGPDANGLKFARRLFARAVETPGGLKIQTIHAFCERLLRMFPFEANVPAGFRVVSDLEGAQLRARACALAMERLEGSVEGAAALEIMRPNLDQNLFDRLMREAIGHRFEIAAAMADGERADSYEANLRKKLGLKRGQSPQSIAQEILRDLDAGDWDRPCDILATGGTNDKKLAGSLRASRSARGEQRLQTYFLTFFTAVGDPRGAGAQGIVTKALAEAHPELQGRLLDEQARLVPLRTAFNSAVLARQSAAVMKILSTTLDAYARLKSAQGALDFDDQIERALALLTRSNSAWVHYKLDAGIDHLLIDEAQDTSPDQWEILTRIAEEFSAGAGARPATRTIFAVGDEKQSIFSFRGARPRLFGEKRKEFQQRFIDAAPPFASEQLSLSFRSSSVVLGAVDQTFSLREAFEGVTFDKEPPPPHTAFHADMAGIVELWPLVSAEPAEALDWRLPVDTITSVNPAVVLARRIAKTIAQWLAPGAAERIIGGDHKSRRKIGPGDILILVRERSVFFEAIIRALKEARVPVAGADRLALKTHIAVMDLIALGRWALNPDDDLELACVLKSPLIGLDDHDLIALAPGRSGALVRALQNSPDARHRSAASRLLGWRDVALSSTPFGFYSQLLSAEGGRKALVARLGAEAVEAINEFLALAQGYERENAPSLTLFLQELDAADIIVKRDMEAAGSSVRVLTVHAAKGLEAPIVFLPDTCKPPGSKHDPKIFRLEPGPGDIPLFLAPSKKQPGEAPALSDAREASRKALQEEYRRLLYVAMTRAAQRLIIAGFSNEEAGPEGSWYRLVADGVGHAMHAAPAPWDSAATILRLGAAPDGGAGAAASPSVARPPLPPWLAIAPNHEPAAMPLRASRGGGAPANGGSGLEAGRLSHILLQYLPAVAEQSRAAAARRYLAQQGAELDEAATAKIVANVIAVLSSKDVAPLFGAASRAEVAIAARFARAGQPPLEFFGRIDRIAVLVDAVLIADYKSGKRPVAGAPPPYVAQLALYRAALASVFAELPVRACIVWLEDASVEAIEDERLSKAFQTLIDGA